MCYKLSSKYLVIEDVMKDIKTEFEVELGMRSGVKDPSKVIIKFNNKKWLVEDPSNSFILLSIREKMQQIAFNKENRVTEA